MSTQNDGFPPVPLHLPEQFQNVRLVEVPDEIADILSQGEILFFKSSPPLTSNGIDKGGNLHLCSNDRAWLVKQVSTSNSLYITQSQTNNNDHVRGPEGSENPLGNKDEVMTDVNTATICNSGYVTAISKPTNVLELYPIPVATQQKIIQEHLASFVPPIDDTFESLGSREHSRYSCKELFNHIPAPNSPARRALAQKCIGDHWQGKAYQPTPSLLLETWKGIITFVISSSLDIDDLLLRDKSLGLQFDDSDDDEQAGHSSILSSIASVLSMSGGYFEENNLVTEGPPQRKFKPQDTARWVGNLILLTSKDKGSALTKEAFESQWEDVVPAAWVKFCSVEVLLPACIVNKGESCQDTVQWAPFQTSDNVYTGTQNGTGKEKETTTKTGASKNKRKWHEKFAAQRNAKK